MENKMPKKPGLFARLFGKGWRESVKELESISAELDKEKIALDQREAEIAERENRVAKKESELTQLKSELQRREAKIRDQEKKLKKKEKMRERIAPKAIEQLEIQAKSQVEVFVGPKVEEYNEKPAQATIEVDSKTIVENKVKPEIEKEESKVEEKVEVVEEPKVEETKTENEVEPEIEKEESKVEEKAEVVEEPKVEETKTENKVEPKIEKEESKVQEKAEVVEEPKVEETKTKNEVEAKVENQVSKTNNKKGKTKTKNSAAKKVEIKSEPYKAPQYSEELNEKRNNAILEALKELNKKMEEQLKLDDIQAATATTRSLESESMVQKRRTANVATIRGYLFGLIAAYLDTLPAGDLKHIEIEGMTPTEFLRFLASDYEFDFQRKENDTKSLAVAKNENFASKRFTYGVMKGYEKITRDVIEKEKYATEIISLANSWLIGSYLDESLDKTAPNMRKGIKIDSQKLVKRDERLEKEFGEAGQVL